MGICQYRPPNSTTHEPASPLDGEMEIPAWIKQFDIEKP